MRAHINGADERELNVIKWASNVDFTAGRKIGETETVKNANQQSREVLQNRTYARGAEIVQN